MTGETPSLFPPRAGELLCFAASLIAFVLVAVNFARTGGIMWAGVVILVLGILLGVDIRRQRKRIGRS